MNGKGNRMFKRCAFIILVVTALAGIFVFWTWNRQKVRYITGTDNLNQYYRIEFEKMNREDFYRISACKDDVFAVNFSIEKGHADLIIAMGEKAPIYKGNDIESGVFDVIVPEDGEYRITVDAKHASGYVEVYEKKAFTKNE